MEIRYMKEQDLVQVCAIEQEIFTEPWNEEDFRNSLCNEKNCYLVAVIDEKIAGYCGCWGIAGEGDIYNVAVKKEYRRKQIGLSLLKNLIDTSRQKGITAFTLEVRSSNEPAIRLYETLGFERSAIRKDFYSKPKEDAVIMWLKPIQ